MVITRESDYAIRMLRALADGKRHNVKIMCEEEDIPFQFAYKILKKLADAGFVHSQRGNSGGCELTIDLHDVTLYDVLCVTDNQCYINLCLTPEFKCNWKQGHDGRCLVHNKLFSIQKSVDEKLKSINLYSLLFDEQ